MADPLRIAVLATLDSKSEAARHICGSLRNAGAEPWLLDLSLRPHDKPGAAMTGGEVVAIAGRTWEALGGLERSAAAEAMIAGGAQALADAQAAGEISGAIGVGGANGCTVFCGMMRRLPPMFPKVMVTPVAATAAVQWYVAESDIAMFPTISDIVMNRITRSIMENAAHAVAAMARSWEDQRARTEEAPPLIGVSSFGNLQAAVDRITDQLQAAGYEVMHFHASGPGGKALENLASRRELTGVIDLTTSEVTDLLTGGVYSAGPDRLTGAATAGLPQVVAPGAIDHTNWWVGECPERFRDREFYQYNPEILLMRTNAEEMAELGTMFAERLNRSRTPFAVLVPSRGFSQHTIRKTHDLDGNEIGSWFQPETDRCFTDALHGKLSAGELKVMDVHINDPEFADACVAELRRLMVQG
ncbi:MAG: Tm-1-like ATP-binding domain-containing protein [Rhodospirillales bacterium]|nr:Tm-1-like ATP-binding domain-containing protein [Rhodospirillales bacterium]